MLFLLSQWASSAKIGDYIITTKIEILSIYGVTLVVLVFACYINSCKQLRIVNGTRLGGGGGCVWTPLETRITYGHFFNQVVLIYNI